MKSYAWLPLVAVLLSAVLMALIWAPVEQASCVWVALVPLLLVTRRVMPRQAWWYGWVMGFTTWLIQLSWMLSLSNNGGPWILIVPAWLALCAVLALFIGLFSVWSAVLWQRFGSSPIGRLALVVLLDPVGWAAMECLRSNVFSGFSWNPLGLACSTYLPILQVAALGGITSVSALLVAVNGAVATFAERFWMALTHTEPTTFSRRVLQALESAFPLGILLIAFIWGWERIRAYDAAPKASVFSVIVERTEVPCIFTGESTFPLWKMGEEKVDLLPLLSPDLWLWPESSVQGMFPYVGAAQVRLRALAERAQTPLLVGGLYMQAGVGCLNAAMLVTEQGLDFSQVYGKRHLVPFGEYFPGDHLFPVLQRLVPTGQSNVPGKDRTLIRLPSGLNVGPLICFEDTVSSVARESVLDGAKVFVNMSNDAWYNPSSLGKQHARQAIARCVEMGVPMVRSTNGGQNLVIDAVGRTSDTEAFPTRLSLTDRPFASAYLKWGEGVFGGPCVCAVLCFFVWLWFRQCMRVIGVFLLTGILWAQVVHANNDLLPVAGMAIDDGNVTLAERAAHAILSKLGISAEERIRAEEVLIRSDLTRKNWDSAQARVEACDELPAEHRLAFLLAVSNGRKDFAQTRLLYAQSHISPTSAWGVASLRLALQADLELGKHVEAAERFAEVNAATGTDARVQAENALLWARHFPNKKSREALLQAATQADQGGVFLECALALPDLFSGTDDASAAITCLERLLESKTVSTAIEARLALAAIALDSTSQTKIMHARQALAAAREESVRRQALTVLGELLCQQPETTNEGLQVLRDAVRLNPSATEAPALQLKIAETLEQLARHDEALQAYDQYLESYDEPAFRVRIRQGRARALLATKRGNEALASLLEAIELEEETKKRETLLMEAADVAITAGQPARAVALYRRLLKTHRSSNVLLHLARALEAENKIDEAMHIYESVWNEPSPRAKDCFVAAMRFGALLTGCKRYAEAIATYTRALASTSDEKQQASLRLARGRAYYASGSLNKAKEDFSAVRESNDAQVASEARFFLVLSLYGLGEDEQARDLAHAYVLAYPHSSRIPDVMLWLAKSDFNRGAYEDACSGFKDFAVRWPNDPRVPMAIYLAARAAYQAQDYTQAIELIGRVARMSTSQPSFLSDARFLQAEALMELARYGEARDLLDTLIRRYPDAPWIGDAYGRKGDCLLMTATDDPGRYALASEAYREALTRLDDPDIEIGYSFKLGRIFEKQQRRNDAAEQYTRLIYRVLAQPENYSEKGLEWVRKAIARLRTIELARGNRSGFETLIRRIRQAELPGIILTEL